MLKVIFDYKGSKIVIQSNNEDKMKDVCERYISKIGIDKSEIYFIYNGSIVSQELKVKEHMNECDKESNIMNILVFDIRQNEKIDTNEGNEANINVIKSNEIICPKCYEICLMEINNYKINLFKCKNGHTTNNIKIENFENTQNINISKIICGECKINNKSNTYNNEMYVCNKCNKNLCPLCKAKHDKEHKLINYDDNKNYMCKIHNEQFIKYCNQCNRNLCLKCGKEHSSHNCIYYDEILNNENDIKNEMNKFREYINKLNNEINQIINKLKYIIENIELYYNINNNIMNNKNRNYQILNNINNIIKYNNNVIIKDIEEIISDNNINNKFNNLMNLYNKMNISNYIIAKIYIKKEDINKEIRIINSSFKNKDNNGNEKEIEENCLIEINNENIPFSYFYTFKKEGKYTIKYTFIKNLTKTNYMFYDCNSLVDIDLSNFNSQNITKMDSMFFGCTSLININLSNFNTQNVIDMSGLFCRCNSLINIDLSNFQTQNVINMSGMFSRCNSLVNLDLSNFNTKNVVNMSVMFSRCNSLININLSNFDTQNVTDMKFMFLGCISLKKENIITKDNKISNEINNFFKTKN